jgi:hypothetical protein
VAPSANFQNLDLTFHVAQSLGTQLSLSPDVTESGLFGAMQTQRCPYCIECDEFKPMVWDDGYYLCVKCGHMVAPNLPAYLCACPNCREIRGKHLIH